MKTPQPKKPRKPTERKDIPVETRKTGSGSTLRSWFSGLTLPFGCHPGILRGGGASHPAPRVQGFVELDLRSRLSPGVPSRHTSGVSPRRFPRLGIRGRARLSRRWRDTSSLAVRWLGFELPESFRTPQVVACSRLAPQPLLRPPQPLPTWRLRRRPKKRFAILAIRSSGRFRLRFPSTPYSGDPRPELSSEPSNSRPLSRSGHSDARPPNLPIVLSASRKSFSSARHLRSPGRARVGASVRLSLPLPLLPGVLSLGPESRPSLACS